MSVRDGFFSLTSIGPLRAVVASGQTAIVRALTEEYAAGYNDDDRADADVRADIEEHRSLLQTMIDCPSPPDEEPGSWALVAEEVARHLGLDPDRQLPFNEGWKHTYVWKAYRGLARNHVPRQSWATLGYLEDGRPLRGKAVDGSDGCLFAWLSTGEVNELYRSLSQLDRAAVASTGLTDFHETLVESFRLVGEQSRDLFMGAC